MTRSIGKVTTASASGGAIGAALAQILVHLVPSLSPVETAITVILTALLGLVGGYLVPPTEDGEGDDADGDFSMDQIDEITTVTKYRPADTGKHAAE